MDLTRPVEYRGLQLNSPSFTSTAPISGIQLEQVDYSEVPGVGYTEKRAAADGYDASDITLGSRSVVLIGTCYGIDPADLFDRLQSLRYAFSPTAAFAALPGEYGYIPLNFEVPTKDSLWLADPVTGVFYIPQCIRVRPLRGPGFNIRRDAMGGTTEGLSIPWQAQLGARDPRIYAQDQREFTDIAGGTAGDHAGTFFNRGDYPAPLNIVLTTTKADAQLVYKLVINDTTMTLTVPTNAANDQVLRYDGTHKVVTLQVGTTVSLRMDLLKFTGSGSHPLIRPGDNPFTWNRAGGPIRPGSKMWFWESWA
jgi:hypothetical protein